jgi:hypothetical protein
MNEAVLPEAVSCSVETADVGAVQHVRMFLNA